MASVEARRPSLTTSTIPTTASFPLADPRRIAYGSHSLDFADSLRDDVAAAQGAMMVSAHNAAVAVAKAKRAPMVAGQQQQQPQPQQQQQQRTQRRGASADDVAFHRWRPSSHLMAPDGWMNDPCGPSYDPRTGQYHMWYQWNPKGSTWGNMSWGHATSKDLVRWQSSRSAVIQPGTQYDHKGVFTGCVLMRGPLAEEDGTDEAVGAHQEATKAATSAAAEAAAEVRQRAQPMTAIYTAVSHLPIHHTLPYHRGAEKLALSTSTDGGQTWTPQGCILDGPPAEVDIISWRDPYVSAWPLLDAVLGMSSPGLYGLIAGGLKDKTPTVFAYSIDPSDLSSWQYIGHLCDVGRNSKSTPHGVDLGKNWEVCNFFSVGPEGDAAQHHDYLLINVEGCTEPGPQRAAIYMKYEAHRRTLQGSRAGISLEPVRTGLLDHGCLYAASSFQDPVKDRRIMWGWITEDDLPEDQYERQGWSGCLSLPRELFWHPDSEELGIRPVEEVLGLRTGARHVNVASLQPAAASRDSAIQIHAAGIEAPRRHLPDVSARSLEVVASLSTPAAGRVSGFALAHSADMSTRTLVYLTADDRIVVDRSRSAGRTSVLERGIEVKTDDIDVALARRRDGSRTTTHRVRLFLDNSVLEVFVDDAIAISTRIYPDEADVGVSLLGCHEEGDAIDIWQGLAQAHAGFLG
ncbi:uncharacterized protein PFL1_02546 [Pseudozyma flocculosa PF-1]|uniref:Related to Sucrose-6-phosphate hydrolase n=2 Tax=Pseudozyma flocculosa TaxID=84751 RepID=A0A5C3F1L8_9BASI|nr:uncharacterized protein PFL1_02546 [Pseudozyma flocculosa PF-1]EPQ29873.1 hypothetical protein PFL1_02546 [Pseudozyma flocculosa PF-1]SPO37171.1 related to Sucrose-6-phosphate hydrolase [Pseudozyma flocculosa]